MESKIAERRSLIVAIHLLVPQEVLIPVILVETSPFQTLVVNLDSRVVVVMGTVVDGLHLYQLVEVGVDYLAPGHLEGVGGQGMGLLICHCKLP